MNPTTSKTTETIVLGDEALALGAIHAGLSSAYGYPGTPSTEIMQYLIDEAAKDQSFVAQWCANEKTALEEAIGTSFAGRRALVTMKHVGLNVAADPFMNASLLNIKGGLVIAVADDPEMHSSQNEQDSRFFADFARIPCLEPTDQQEAYNMVQVAFDLSETLHVPVLLRLTTRLSHSRAPIAVGSIRAQNPASKALDRENWILVPSRAKVRWNALLDLQPKMVELSESSPFNQMELGSCSPRQKAAFGVLTSGLGFNYFRENRPELNSFVPYLHIGQYPLPVGKIRALAASVETLVVLEEGYPFIERLLRGILPSSGPAIKGKMDSTIPAAGELTPENVRPALGLPAIIGTSATASVGGQALPVRPPQLCAGCPHGDSYNAVKEALSAFKDSVVCADIGCYALGVLPPYAVPETIVCMGASITMAKGASEAGYRHAVAVIGDSTFLHSGITGLIDAVSANASMTVLILDNGTVAMTGGQPTILPGHRLAKIAEAVGVDPAHIHVTEAHRKFHAENLRILKDEIAYEGVSVVITVRECIETARKVKKTGGES